jgi:hypothetical protein
MNMTAPRAPADKRWAQITEVTLHLRSAASAQKFSPDAHADHKFSIHEVALSVQCAPPAGFPEASAHRSAISSAALP